MENKDQISFGLRKITTEQFAIIESAFDKSNQNIQIGNGLRFGFNLEKRVITVLLSVQFNQDKGPFLLLEIGCLFEIIPEHWKTLYDEDTKEIKIPIALARHLVVLAMGTLRGVLLDSARFEFVDENGHKISGLIGEEIDENKIIELSLEYLNKSCTINLKKLKISIPNK